MDDRITFGHALDLAICREQSTADFYAWMAERAVKPDSRDMFLLFAKEERAHKAKLEFIKSIGEMEPVSGCMMDLNPADYPGDAPSSPDVAEALQWGMKKEKTAFKFFNVFASLAPNDALRAAFSTLALEEANHKLKLEIAWDELEGCG
jgi:rubrerythrin